nr:beta-propeller fold lactonase family protein [Paenibacillus silagei]
MVNRRRNLASNINPYVFASYELSNYFGYVAVIDPVYNKVIKRIPVGLNPGPMCMDPSEQKLFVVNTSSGSVTVIDTNTFAILKTVRVGTAGSTTTNPVAVFVGPDGRKAYVANYGDHNVTIIDTSTYTVIKNVPMIPDLTGNPGTPGELGKPFAFASNKNSSYVSVACKVADTKDFVVAIDLETDNVHPYNDGIELTFDGTHNPLVVHPDGHTQVTLGETGMLTYFGSHEIGFSFVVGSLRNTVSGVYLDNKMLFCTMQEGLTFLERFNNLYIDSQGFIFNGDSTFISSYKGQDKILASSNQSTICITIQPTTFPTGGLQIYDVNAASSRFVPLPYVGDLALVDDIIAYVGQLTSIQPIDLGNPSNPIPAIPIGTSPSDRVNVKNIISGYSNRSL